MEPIYLRPKEAFATLGIKATKGWSLVASGELQAVKLGRATLISVESIKSLAGRLSQQQRKTA